MNLYLQAQAFAPASLNPTTGALATAFLKGFYQHSDDREEISGDSRACADQLANGQVCSGDADHTISRVRMRVFGSTALNGKTRLIVFTWAPQSFLAGPSDQCSHTGCATLYPLKVYDEAGGVIYQTEIELVDVVNVIEVNTTQAGFASIWNVSGAIDTQVYAFSFNSAFPSSNPDLTWDAIFEGFIVP